MQFQTRLGAGWLLALTLALSPASLEAEPNAAGQAALILSKDVLAPEDRRKAPAAIGAFCYTYANAIPRPSPREQDRLDGELSSERAPIAMDSVEYSKSIAGENARGCVSYTISLERASAVASRVATRGETLLWALLAWELLESDFQHYISQLAYARAVVLSEDQIKMSGSGPLLGRSIIRNIVIPYLNQK
jgi:hypothetical protein